MKSWLVASAAGLALLAGIPTANAVTPVLSVPSLEILHVPFSPPTDVDIVYDVTQIRPGDAKKRSDETRQSLRFERSENGYVLTLSHVRIGSDSSNTDPDAQDAAEHVPAELRPFLLPMVFDVADDGSLVRLRNWSELRNVFSTLPDVLVAAEHDPQKRDHVRRFAESIIAPYLDLTAESAPGIVAKVWSNLSGYGGMALQDGVEFEGSGEAQGLFQIMMPITGRFSLERTPSAGGLRYRKTTQFDQKGAAEAVSRYFSQIGRASDDEARAQIQQVVEMVKDMKISDETEIVFDTETGLVETAIIERKVADSGGLIVERTLVKRVR